MLFVIRGDIKVPYSTSSVTSSTWMMMMSVIVMMMMSIIVMVMGKKFYISCVNSIYIVQTFGSNRSLRVIDI